MYITVYSTHKKTDYTLGFEAVREEKRTSWYIPFLFCAHSFFSPYLRNVFLDFLTEMRNYLDYLFC